MRSSLRWHCHLFLLVIVLKCVYCFPVQSPTIRSLLQQAKDLIVVQKDSEAAFAVLSLVYQQNPNAAGLSSLLESCLRLRIDVNGSDHDRFGLSSLLVDQERYEEACFHLQIIVDSDNPALVERVYSVFYRSKAAICDWESSDDSKLISYLKLEERLSSNDYKSVPSIHPFEALKWSCISMHQATQIAQLYARRAVLSQGLNYAFIPQKRSSLSLSPLALLKFQPRDPKVRLGYLSPDFSTSHPLPFLMQHVFQHHDRRFFEVHIFSISKPQNCSEVRAIIQGSDVVTILPTGHQAKDLAARIHESKIDILVDLCGYTGTSLVAEIMAHRPAPIQLSYMGFPGSSGAPYIDYTICDETVVPPCLRHHYTEGLIVMPNSYFVNSHATGIPPSTSEWKRSDYGLPEDAFVFCCHSRPDKLDPQIFDSWTSVIRELRDQHDVPAVLWLLRSCPTMEQNLRRRGQLPEEALVFSTIAPRPEHLHRLSLADAFLDTPAYNAHTVGCDTLYAGVPMITLLSDKQEKLASRVGASLLRAVGLEELVATSFVEYEDLMIRSALDQSWWQSLCDKLTSHDAPLFDTGAWVRYLDRAFLHLATQNSTERHDIILLTE
jgi:protein O-GlcNAc transferase